MTDPLHKLVDAVTALLPATTDDGWDVDGQLIFDAVFAAVQDGYVVPDTNPDYPDDLVSLTAVNAEHAARHLVADAAARAKYGIPDPAARRG